MADVVSFSQVFVDGEYYGVMVDAVGYLHMERNEPFAGDQCPGMYVVDTGYRVDPVAQVDTQCFEVESFGDGFQEDACRLASKAPGAAENEQRDEDPVM